MLKKESFFALKIAVLWLFGLYNFQLAIAANIPPTRLSQEVLQSLRREHAVLNDPLLTSYLQHLGDRLAAQAPHPKPYQLIWLRNPTINAFSVPGGLIAVNTGLLMAAKTEGELAAVLSHEIAHEQQQHFQRQQDYAKGTGLSGLAATIAAIALGGGVGAAMLITGEQQSIQYNRLRQYEREADSIGMNILYNSGYNPTNMPSFFKRLLEEQQLNADNIPDILQSHPATSERLAQSEDRAAQFSARPFHFSDTFELMKVYLTVLSNDDPSRLLRTYSTPLFRSTKTITLRYGLALTFLKMRRYTEAKQQLDWLRSQAPQSIIISLAYADYTNAKHHPETTIELLTPFLKKYPSHYPLIIALGEALFSSRHMATALSLLLSAQRSLEQYPDYNGLLARVQSAAGDPAGAYSTRAKVLFQSGFPREAIASLKRALLLPKLSPNVRRQLQQQRVDYEAVVENQ